MLRETPGRGAEPVRTVAKRAAADHVTELRGGRALGVLDRFARIAEPIGVEVEEVVHPLRDVARHVEDAVRRRAVHVRSDGGEATKAVARISRILAVSVDCID